jgi:tRNA-splicing ligase RtcB (3'-phosphate/5'-hydroxy nucleic acid ligase)
MPFIHKHISLMPDAHLGKGCSVGSVVPTLKAIIPASVGVDIGCGMLAVTTNLSSKDLPENLDIFRHSIERDVPLGPGGQRKTARMPEFYIDYGPITNNELMVADYAFRNLKGLSERVLGKSWMKQLGTLGSGNHFIELCLDQNDQVWIMLHSGSRGIGNLIGQHFISEAKSEMEKYHIHLPNKDLSYLSQDTEKFNNYIAAVNWCQQYASINRRMMLGAIHKNLIHFFPHVKLEGIVINCHHNYVEMESHFNKNVWVTRKGAIRARENDWGIIPGSMGTKSFIVTGKGNEESFHSCSHGAGRTMSRTEAKKRFTVRDLEEQTKGISCQKDASVLDEIPSSYKDIDSVMKNQEDLVNIEFTLKQILNIKGG